MADGSIDQTELRGMIREMVRDELRTLLKQQVGELMRDLAESLEAPPEGPTATGEAPTAAATTPARPTASGKLDPRTLAIITAAAFAAVGRPLRVRNITFLNQNTISAWAEVGRIAIHSSHQLRRNL